MKWYHLVYLSMLVVGSVITNFATPKQEPGRTPQSINAQSAMIDYASSAGM